MIQFYWQQRKPATPGYYWHTSLPGEDEAHLLKVEAGDCGLVVDGEPLPEGWWSENIGEPELVYMDVHPTKNGYFLPLPKFSRGKKEPAGRREAQGAKTEADQ